MTTDHDPDRFEELRARAEGLGWELKHKDDPTYRPYGYVLRPFDAEFANAYTNSAVRLDPEDSENPLSGLDSVSHMLDQIEFAQLRDPS
jgi:hypothetical protein